jgi:hypothetical protein
MGNNMPYIFSHHTDRTTPTAPHRPHHTDRTTPTAPHRPHHTDRTTPTAKKEPENFFKFFFLSR